VRERRGVFDGPVSVQAFIKFREATVTTETGASGAYGRARTSLIRERMLAARLARKRAEGENLPRAVVQALLMTNNKVIRDRLLGTGVRIAPWVHAAATVPACQAIIDLSIRESLELVAATRIPQMMQQIEVEASRLVGFEPRQKDDGDEKQVGR
jgi:hypothetical protein